MKREEYACEECGEVIDNYNDYIVHLQGCIGPIKEAKRDSCEIRYDILDPDFEELMGKIADYGAKKYGDLNWHKSRLTGDKSPMNHIRKHLAAYLRNQPYDHTEIGTHRKIHLAAIAFNAMMEFWYENNNK
jgi:hypothetical protein